MLSYKIAKVSQWVKLAIPVLVVVLYFIVNQTTNIPNPKMKTTKFVMRTEKQQEQRQTEKLLHRFHFTWLIKSPNVLPNYFTRDDTTLYTDQAYVDATIGFIHNQKSGGTTTKSCLRTLLNPEGDSPSQGVTNGNAIRAFTDLEEGGFNQTLRKVFTGSLVFGICRYTTQPCSYFTILRDPYERVISAYNLCHLTGTHQCKIKNATAVPLKEWAINQGSWFFRQLAQNPEFFTPKYDDMLRKLADADPDTGTEIPPWWRNALILNEVMTCEQKDVVLDYILDNLESWFAVIGLTSETETNYKLLEHVYKLPFTTVCESLHKNQRSYAKVGASSDDISKEVLVTKMRNELASDDEVNEALRYDIVIFRKVQEIFKKQVAVYDRKKSEGI